MCKFYIWLQKTVLKKICASLNTFKLSHIFELTQGISLMFKKILKTYLTLFVLFYVGYSFLNWLLTTKTGLIKIDKSYSNFWVPFTIIYIPVFFLLRPLVKKSELKPKTQDGLLWVIFPFTISIPTAFSQDFFKDSSFRIINVKNTEDVLLYPRERFYKIEEFQIKNDGFTLFKERHVSGGRSKSLEVNNYYIAPMYGSNRDTISKVAYGLIYSVSLNHGLLYRDEQPKKIEEFNTKTAEEFSNHNLYQVTFFEKQMDTEQAEHFALAWKQNNMLDQNTEPIVLVPKEETLQQLLKRERGIAVYSVVICVTVAIGLLYIFEYFRK